MFPVKLNYILYVTKHWNISIVMAACRLQCIMTKDGGVVGFSDHELLRYDKL